jgi:hypothetical protein
MQCKSDTPASSAFMALTIRSLLLSLVTILPPHLLLNSACLRHQVSSLPCSPWPAPLVGTYGMSSFAVRAQPSPCALVWPAALAGGKADPHQRAANHQKLGVETERERRKQVSNLREEDGAGVIDGGRRRTVLGYTRLWALFYVGWQASYLKVNNLRNYEPVQ